MIFTESHLRGNYLIDLELRSDDRGFFARYFCEREFQTHDLNTKWVQINNSLCKDSRTLRGLHFQRPPHSEVKLVRCLKGAIWDVVVDLRQDSKTFGKWFGATLSAENRTMMYAPQGFAHGFISLEANSEILYLVSSFYEPASENTLLWSDPHIGIAWPILPDLISAKDSIGSLLSEIGPIRI